MPILIGPWAHARRRYPGTPTLATTPPATAVVRKSRRFMVGPPWPVAVESGVIIGREGPESRASRWVRTQEPVREAVDQQNGTAGDRKDECFATKSASS